jgi:hypothetical protein
MPRERRAHVVGHTPLGSWSVSGRKRVGSETSGMQRAPVWRLWTGAALAALVVWGIIKG